jgi:hypothetical protein
MADIKVKSTRWSFRMPDQRVRKAQALLKVAICCVVACSNVLAIGQTDDRPSATAASGFGDAERPNRKRVPDAASREKAMADIRKVFADEAENARTPEAKGKLSRRLLQVATDDSQPADCYALLEAAKALAIEAGDTDLSIEILDKQAAAFALDERSERTSILKALTKSTSPAEVGKVVDLLLREADSLSETRDFDQSLDLVTLAQNAARRGKDPARQKAVTSRLAALRDRAKQAEKIEPLLSRLKADPSDREAATLVGKHRCFVEGDWEAGLPLLAKGDDLKLANLSRLDLSAQVATGSHVRAGDAWWEYKEANNGAMAAAADERARFHYGSSLNDLRGLEKARIEQRLQTTEKLAAKRPRPKGLLLWLDASLPSSIGLGIQRPSEPNSGMAVSRWTDANGSIQFEHAGSGQMPLLISKGLDGHPAISFRNGSLLQSNFKVAKQGTLAVVMKLESAATANMVPLGCKEAGAGIQFRFYSDGRTSFRVVRKAAEYDAIDAPKKLAMNSGPLIVVATWPDPFAFSANEITGVSRTPSSIDPSLGLGMVLGARSEEGTYPFNSLICEVMVFDQVLSPAAVSRLKTDLAAKWAPR